MVSFQALPSFPNGNAKAIPELLNSSHKRKWDEPQTEGILEKRSKSEKSTKSIFEVELHLETPLPLEWQRCLDIQSGHIHFYNTRTQKRTSKDPRRSPEPPSSPDHHDPHHMSLDLELNLPCESQRSNKNHAKDHVTNHNSTASIPNTFGDLLSRDNKNSSSGGLLRRCPSWLAFERDQQEMVATVCTRCHMLVMLCKSSLACPNCKFVHPPDQTHPKLFKERLSGLLC